MKIGIVGAGFYGCYLARAIERKWGGTVIVDLFDREAKPMSRAAINNQSRLHLGFHYPRSKDTIFQTVSGYREFKEEFGSCLQFPSQNFYAVHRHGLTGYQDYLKAMDAFGLEYEVCGPEVMRYFRDASLLEGVIRVHEGVIDLRKLEGMILSELRADVHCSSVVTEINPESGTLVVNGMLMGPYDFIINATYVDPNLGLPDSKQFDLKYEITAMVVMDAPFSDDVALTVMDGSFVSLYPCGRNLATLSSVTHTPFAKYDTVAELEANYVRAKVLAKQCDVKEKLLSHGEELLGLDRDSLRCHGLWISPKTKLRDDAGDTRISAVRCEGRLVSVLCGKLDAVHAIADEVLATLV